VLTTLLLWYVMDVAMMLFGGVLVAIFFRGLSNLVSIRTGLSSGWSLCAVLLLLLAITTAIITFVAPDVVEQTGKLAEELPRSFSYLKERVEEYGWGQWLIDQMPSLETLEDRTGGLMMKATGFFTTTFGAITSFIIVFFIGLYLAIDPGLYINGIIRLTPLDNRDRARQVLYTIGFTLQWWLIGRFIQMVFVGFFTWLGLWLMGVPLSLTLGILAGLLNFIPNIGPVVSAVPAVLLALLDSPAQALYVMLLYTVVQTFESSVLTPLVQLKTISMPPVLTLIAQIVLGVLLGIMGLVLATPLAASVLVIIKMLYVEDVLGDSLEVQGEKKE
jgi:predicted PurR-regulated permease PerM